MNTNACFHQIRMSMCVRTAMRRAFSAFFSFPQTSDFVFTETAQWKQSAYKYVLDVLLTCNTDNGFWAYSCILLFPYTLSINPKEPALFVFVWSSR